MRIGLYVIPTSGPASAAGAALRGLIEQLGGIAISLAPEPAAAQASLPLSVDGVVVVGGFGLASDAAAAGEGARPLPAIAAFARARGPVLGIGAGFQVLCAMGLLPGRVTLRIPTESALAPASHLRIEGRPTAFTSAIPAGRVMRLSSGPAAADTVAPTGPLSVSCYETDEADALEARGQVVFRYCDAAGRATQSPAPRGPRAPRSHSIAGVCDAGGQVVGLLSDPGGDGQQLLRSLRLHLGASRG